MKSALDRLNELKPKFRESLKDNILDFWATKTVDEIHGGFFGLINAENEAVQTSTKGLILNTRILWAFSSSYQYFKSDNYRQLADRAYTYISENFIDKKWGGVYWELDFSGKPVNRRKQIYAQSFAIYSFAEYFKISGQQTVLENAIHLYRLIEKHSLDREHGGYIEAFGEEWTEIHDFRLSEKDLNAPKTMNTHIHVLEAYTNLYSIWKDDGLRKSLKSLIELFLQKFIDKRGHLILFFDNKWNQIEDFCSFGHDIEFSWLLTEAASLLGDSGLVAKCNNLSLDIATLIQKEAIAADGGIMNEFNYVDNSLDSDKHWWPQAEAMLGFFNAFKIGGDEKYLYSVVNTWDFIDKYIIDHKNGEWFWKVDVNNKVYPGMEKAGFWKCPYHNTRALLMLLQSI
jgi:cellobiose epimerase